MYIQPGSFVRHGILFLAAVALCSVGCGCGRSPQPKSAVVAMGDPGRVGQEMVQEDVPAMANEQGGPAVKEAAAAPGKPAGGAGGQLPTPMPRKVVYNATVELIAEDLGTTEQELRQLVKRVKGYIAKSDLQGTAGTRRSGSWTIRVPVNQFDDFREGLTKLGEMRRDSLDSQDVTDQFYDLEARIRTNRAEEESLQKLLVQAHNQPEFYQLRQELNRIRGDLEVQQGQLQRLDKLSTLATYQVTIQERRGYVPPETPSFDTRLSRAWGDSIASLRTFGQEVILIVVVLTPWLPVLALGAAPLWLLRRQLSRPGAASTPPAALEIEPAVPPPS